MVAAVVAAGAGSVLTASGCIGCTGEAYPGLRVFVLDGAGGAEVCDATVTVTDGAYAEVLKTYGPGVSPCFYFGAYERPGAYTIEATFDGRTATTPNVHVNERTCHVDTREIEMILPVAAAAPVAETPAEP
jgi:hypothetical protein